MEATQEAGGHMSLITIPCDVTDYVTVDGDLTNPETRHLLANGFCGNLAEAIHNLTNSPLYFVVYRYKASDSKKLISDCEADASLLMKVGTHAMVQSPTNPELFLDAYGQKTRAQVEEFYGNGFTLVEGTPWMLEQYRTPVDSRLFTKFAQAVLELDAEEVTYSYM